MEFTHGDQSTTIGFCCLNEKGRKVLEKTVKNDPRARCTRQMLQQAMMELMKEKQFSEISIQDITSRADVNRATFYAHFYDKYDLVNAIIRSNFQNALDKKL